MVGAVLTDPNPIALVTAAYLHTLGTLGALEVKRRLVVGRLCERGWSKASVQEFSVVPDWLMQLPKELERWHDIATRASLADGHGAVGQTLNSARAPCPRRCRSATAPAACRRRRTA
jgi:hypothetical protein